MGFRNGLTKRRPTPRWSVVGIAGPEPLDRALYYRLRRVYIGVADTEDDHILAPIACRRSLGVGTPGVRAFTANALN
jgi:hypothetical protein